MIKHIVIWDLKDNAEGKNRSENALLLKSALMGLRGHIPEILELEVGIQSLPGAAFSDVVLVSSFKSQADLEIYQKHPEHQKVVSFVKKIVSDRRAVDYEV